MDVPGFSRGNPFAVVGDYNFLGAAESVLYDLDIYESCIRIQRICHQLADCSATSGILLAP